MNVSFGTFDPQVLLLVVPLAIVQLTLLVLAGLPVVVTLAGGYAPDVADTVDIHAATIAAAAQATRRRRRNGSLSAGGT